MQPSGIQVQSGPSGTLIRFDTRQPEARKAVLASLDRLGPKGRELSQAEAGVRMGLAQRQRAANGFGAKGAARYMLRSAIRRLRAARRALEG